MIHNNGDITRAAAPAITAESALSILADVVRIAQDYRGTLVSMAPSGNDDAVRHAVSHILKSSSQAAVMRVTQFGGRAPSRTYDMMNTQGYTEIKFTGLSHMPTTNLQILQARSHKFKIQSRTGQ